MILTARVVIVTMILLILSLGHMQDDSICDALEGLGLRDHHAAFLGGAIAGCEAYGQEETTTRALVNMGVGDAWPELFETLKSAMLETQPKTTVSEVVGFGDCPAGQLVKVIMPTSETSEGTLAFLLLTCSDRYIWVEAEVAGTDHPLIDRLVDIGQSAAGLTISLE
jgi:hypothetical protein